LLANARVVLERDRNLLAQDSIAKQDVDTQEATTKQLEGTVTADRAAVGTARLNLAYSRVTAPIAGRVGLRSVDIGNVVSTSDTNGIATITQLTPIDVVFTLPADSVSAVQQRMNGHASLPATVLDRTRTQVLGTGTFLTLDNQIDAQTGTVRAKARFANDGGKLFPNQFVNVQLQLDVVHQAIVVPAAAVRHGPRGDFVYVIAPDRTAHIRYVKLGPAVDDSASVSSGLQLAERVVTEGGDRLTDGSPVRLPGQSGGPGGRPRRGGAAAAPGAEQTPSPEPSQRWRRGGQGRHKPASGGNGDAGG
jgi:membrane fusion protein, multidrug efflux system